MVKATSAKSFIGVPFYDWSQLITDFV